MNKTWYRMVLESPNSRESLLLNESQKEYVTRVFMREISSSKPRNEKRLSEIIAWKNWVNRTKGLPDPRMFNSIQKLKEIE